METLTRAPLSVEEERHLVALWSQRRDGGAATRLMLAHHGLVRAVAGKYRHFGLGFEDLVAEGSVGMFKALERFDPARGVRLSTYARYWIKSQIMTYVLKNLSVVNTGNPTSHPKLFYKLRRERSRAVALNGEGSLADERIAERLGISVDEARDLVASMDARDLSLDAPLSSDRETSLLDRLASTAEPQPTFGRIAPYDALRTAIAELDARERYVIERRWLSGDETVSLASIARTLGVSRERARQLEKHAKLRLRQRLARAQPASASSSAWASSKSPVVKPSVNAANVRLNSPKIERRRSPLW